MKINVSLNCDEPMMREFKSAELKTRIDKGTTCPGKWKWAYWYWEPESRPDSIIDCGYSGIREDNDEFAEACARFLKTS